MGRQKEEEERKDRTALLLQERKKIIYNLVLLGAASFVVLIGVLTMAWFANNTKVNGSNLNVTVGGANFEISMLDESRDGIFKIYHDEVHEVDAIYWKMTADENLINYNPPVDHDDPEPDEPGDRGIHPGTSGVISFYVTPKINEVNLIFDFEIIGYQGYINDNDTPANKDDDEIVMTPISEISDCVSANNVINGHILLFEHRTGTEGNYVYSTPICSNNQMHRIMNRTVYKNEENKIEIYWVWPNTLSTLVDASASDVSTVPFCQDNDEFGYDSYTAIIGNIEDFPHYYLKGANSSDNITAADIGAHYVSYGDMYDQGDNEIGMRVNYLLIKLSVMEGAAGGGGS